MQSRKNYRNENVKGKRYGNLVALEKVSDKRTQWIFQCDCGNKVNLCLSRVLYGQLSCGCVRRKVVQEWATSHTTHGDSKTKLYHKYRGMLERCYDSKSWKYKRYGGRGITVCDEWRNSFEAFREWAYETGYDPDCDHRKEQSIDRIDNNGPYSPENCKWSTAEEQSKNRECTKLYPYKGEMYSASEFARKFGISDISFVYRRIKANQDSLEHILYDWNMIHNVPEHLIEVSEYASMLNVTDGHVRRLLRNDSISGEKVGRKWYVARKELDNLCKHKMTRKEKETQCTNYMN